MKFVVDHSEIYSSIYCKYFELAVSGFCTLWILVHFHNEFNFGIL